MTECDGELELWIDVDDTTDGTCNTEEYESDEIYVPTSGTDKANIDNKYQFLKPPCFCFIISLWRMIIWNTEQKDMK